MTFRELVLDALECKTGVLAGYTHILNTSDRQASKGSVQILNSNGRLQVWFCFASKRDYISLSFSGISENRKLAGMQAREIELDIFSGDFDPTLATYKSNQLSVLHQPTLPPLLIGELLKPPKGRVVLEVSLPKGNLRGCLKSVWRLRPRLQQQSPPRRTAETRGLCNLPRQVLSVSLRLQSPKLQDSETLKHPLRGAFTFCYK